MKVTDFRVFETDMCQIRLVAETQEDAANLFKLGTFIKKPNELYGKVDEEETWAWLNIPLNKFVYPKYFGNLDK